MESLSTKTNEHKNKNSLRLRAKEGGADFDVPISSEEGNKLGLFNRLEDKFFISFPQEKRLMQALSQHMNLSYPHPGTTFTLVESLYFDSPELDFFQHHFLELETRYKLRVRRYAPNGYWQDGPFLLELKMKKGEVTKKTRFFISDGDLQSLLQKRKLQDHQGIRQINSNLKEDELLKRMTKINSLFSSYCLSPIVKISYHRVAFEKDGFRVTVDNQLQAEEQRPLSIGPFKKLQKTAVWEKANQLLERYSDQNSYILELKHQGNIPPWMNYLLKDLNLTKTSFSKYCWFAAQMIKRAST